MAKLARAKGAIGEIAVTRDRRTGAYYYEQADSYQSQADRDGISLAHYIHALYGLALQTRAREVLMIGCGGGSLASMLADAGSNVTCVDIFPASFELARKYFFLSPLVKCVVADGAAFMNRRQQLYDLIVLDAFIGTKIPEHLRSPGFIAKARERLARGGTVLMNVVLTDDRDDTADAIAASMEATGLRVQILDTPTDVERNAIVIGSLAGALRKPRLLMPPRITRRTLAAEIEMMQFRPWCRRGFRKRGA